MQFNMSLLILAVFRSAKITKSAISRYLNMNSNISRHIHPKYMDGIYIEFDGI